MEIENRNRKEVKYVRETESTKTVVATEEHEPDRACTS